MKREVQPRLLTALCYAAMMCLAIGINLLPVFLTSIGASFRQGGSLSREELGRLGAVAFAGLVVGIGATGPLADRYGAKPFVILANILTVLGLAGMAASQTFTLLLATVFVVGLGAGMLDMILSPVVAALNPERRTAAMNWLHSFYPVGAVVTIFIGTLALALDVGWRAVCWLSIALPLGLTLAFLPLRFPELTTTAHGRTSIRELCAKPWFLIALAAIFMGGATELGMAQWLPAYAETSLGFLADSGGCGAVIVLHRYGTGADGRRNVGSVGKCPRDNGCRQPALGRVLSAWGVPRKSCMGSCGLRGRRLHGQQPVADDAGCDGRSLFGRRRQHVCGPRGIRQRRRDLHAVGDWLRRRCPRSALGHGDIRHCPVPDVAAGHAPLGGRRAQTEINCGIG